MGGEFGALVAYVRDRDDFPEGGAGEWTDGKQPPRRNAVAVDDRAIRAGLDTDMQRIDPREAPVIWDDFFERGGNFYDTAHIYYRSPEANSDTLLGRWVRSRGVRDQVVVLAKGAHTPNCSELASICH